MVSGMVVENNMLLVISLVLVSVSSRVLPADFAWGTATAAYQVEGAWNVSKKGESIWDYFTEIPGRIYNNETGQVADDFYYRYPGDIQILRELGIPNFRVSISWPRILPDGDVNNPDPVGVQFYMDLFKALLKVGIKPWVTLYHWDLPQAFNDFSENGTWLNPDIVHKFNDYADFCFKTYGHLVKHWLTMNEIQSFAWIGYGAGTFAPGRCSPDVGSWCEKVGGGGNSSTEPYLVAHNALIAHALAVQTYRNKYQKAQGGKIGMTINSGFALPFNTSDPEDRKAVDISIAFQYSWFADPMVFGSYPPEMVKFVEGGRLPSFNESMSQLIKGSYDFLGLNYYSSGYVQWTGIPGNTYVTDSRTRGSPYNATGNLIGPFAASPWLNVYPPGLRKLLKWISDRYNRPEIYVFENGVSCPGENSMPESEALEDNFRMNYVYDHILELIDAHRHDNVNVKGYFLWSLIDNFEWTDGYSVRFGIVYIDYLNGLTRTIKDSGFMYSDLIQQFSGTLTQDSIKKKHLETN